MAYPDEEQPRLFAHPDASFVRTGYCCRCGECCKGDPFTPALSELPLEEAAKEGANVVDGCVYCPLFARDAEGVGACTDREHPYYLAGCVDWPTRPEHLEDKPSCTYRFERVR